MQERKEALKRLSNELTSTCKMNPSVLISTVYNEFKVFVTHKDKLKTAIKKGILIYDYNFYINNFKDSIFENVLATMISCFKNAFIHNKLATINFIQNWQSNISNGIKNMSELAYIEEDKNKIKRLDLFAKLCFQQLGDIIEGSLKQYIKFFYGCYLITKGNTINLSINIKKATLGHCIDSLFKYNEDFSILYKNSFLNIKLNHWRNISNHNSYFIQKEKKTITAKFGYNNENKIEINRDQLKKISIAVYAIYCLHKLAHTLIIIDNSEFLNDIDNSYTEDTIFAQIVESAHLYGLNIKNFEEHDNIWIFDFDYNCLNIEKDDPNLTKIVSLIGSIISKKTSLLISNRNNSRLVEIRIDPIASSSEQFTCGWKVWK